MSGPVPPGRPAGGPPTHRPGAGSTAAAAGRSARPTVSAPATEAPAPVAAPTASGTAAEWTAAAAGPTDRPADQAYAPVGLLGQSAAAGTAGALATPAGRAAAAAVAAAAAAATQDTPRPTGARSGATPPRPPRPGGPGRRRLPGGLRTGQLVAVEVALAGVLAVHRQPPAVLVPVAVAAVLVTALALVRWSGRWASQWADLWLRHRLGRRRHQLPPAHEPAATADAVLDAVVQGGWLDELDLDGVPAALWTHAGGLAVAVEVAAVGPLPFLAVRQQLPAVTSLLPAADEGGTRFTVQLLEQTLVAPTGSEDPASLSYRELTQGSVPALRRCWVALQVVRSPADDDPATLRADLANATRRVLRRLRRAGLRAVPLGRDDAVLGLLGLLGTEPPPARPQTVERWRTWSAGERSCTTFLLALPAGADAAQAFAELRARATTSGFPTTVALAARRLDETELELQVTVRAVLPTGTDPDTVTRALSGPADPASGVLRRLDGQQAAGVAATLPLGGFLR